MKKPRLVLLVVGVVLLAAASSFFLMPKETEQRLFAFYLPWDDAEETVVSLSRWLDKPAGCFGHVYVGEGGHLCVGTERIRFLGVNICGGAAFPQKEDAEKIAGRLAKFGVNIVRFHHMDASWEPFNIFDGTFGNTRHLSGEALDRLDYFTAKLKENGIYVDLNLLVSRRLTSADGLPTEIDIVEWKDQQVLGFFIEEFRDLQEEYAKQLLTHRNPYTGLTYAEDPAVAFVEIVNEQGLIHGWLGGVIDGLPDIFKESLSRKWNEYLKQKYGSTENLAGAWKGAAKPPQAELIDNGCFEEGLEGWNTERHGKGEASYKIVENPDRTRSLEVEVTEPGSAGWHVQFNYPRLEVKSEETYLVSFRARADRQVEVDVALKEAHEPWGTLSGTVRVGLTPEWKQYEIALIPSRSDNDARLDVSNLGASAGIYEFSCFSMKPFEGYLLREGENIEDSTVCIFTLGEFGGRTLAAREDWVEFLWGLEEEYFTGMQRYLKDELNVEALVIGTIVGCSTPNIMAKLDVIDTHAYWHHPSFPGIAWDSTNWYVVNEPMASHLDEGTISSLAAKRVYGKPHIVSEYNHPAPNMYDAEAAIILAAYAALQDWDGIFLFDYGSLDNWDARRIGGYFDISQHPAKMATMIPAHLMFVEGDVEPARELVAVWLDTWTEKDLIARGKARAWNLPDAGNLGVQPTTELAYRTAIIVEDGPKPPHGLNPQDVSIVGPVYGSDEQVVWDISDREKGVLLVNTTRNIVVVGFGGGRTFDFGNVLVAPGPTLLEGWSVVTLSVMDGESFQDWDALLLIATGYTTNKGRETREYETGRVLAVGSTSLSEIPQYDGGITCGTDWGEAPTLVEGVPVTVKIETSADIVVWALSNTGRRARQVPVSVDGEYRVFSIGPEYETMWYEIAKE